MKFSEIFKSKLLEVTISDNMGILRQTLIIGLMIATVIPVKIPCQVGYVSDRLKGCISCAVLCIPGSDPYVTGDCLRRCGTGRII